MGIVFHRRFTPPDYDCVSHAPSCSSPTHHLMRLMDEMEAERIESVIRSISAIDLADRIVAQMDEAGLVDDVEYHEWQESRLRATMDSEARA